MSEKSKKSSKSIAELEHENSILRTEIDDLKLKLVTIIATSCLLWRKNGKLKQTPRG